MASLSATIVRASGCCCVGEAANIPIAWMQISAASNTTRKTLRTIPELGIDQTSSATSDATVDTPTEPNGERQMGAAQTNRATGASARGASAILPADCHSSRRPHPMHTARPAALLALAGAILAFPVSPLSAAANPDKKSHTAAAAPETNPWDAPQPAVEKLDLNTYARIREEGIAHSHVMDLASALDDDIGGRLTGSPNMEKANNWTRDQLPRMGLVNAHLEDWGEFGLGWQQLNTWVRMTAPDTAPFIAQATPWSPATNGAVTGEAINVNIDDEKDFDKYKGKLAGKIVLLGEMRDVPPVDKPLFERYTDKDLEELDEHPAGDQNRDYANRVAQYLKRYAMRDKIAAFLVDEKAAGVILPSRDGKNSGGSGGTFFDDNGAALGSQPYKADKAVKLPVVVTAIENYGRVYRLLQAHVPVTLEMNVETTFTGDHQHGFHTAADTPGTDPP